MATSIIDDIMKWYYNHKDFKKLIQIHTETPEMLEEAYQEIAMIIIEYDRTKIIDLWNRNELKYFIIRIIKNTLYSKTSPFYKKIKKFNDLTSSIECSYYDKDDYETDHNLFHYYNHYEDPTFDEDFDEDLELQNKRLLLNQINTFLDEKEMKSTADYHDVQLFKMYKFSTMTYREVQEKTKIHYTYVYRSVKRVEAQIIKKFKNKKQGL